MTDAEGKYFEDNDERMIFFARGVLETVKKLRWAPDIIHCHGWITSLVPMYIKKSYVDEPLFNNSKVIFSAYDKVLNDKFRNDFPEKMKFDGIDDKDLKMMENPTFDKLSNIAFQYSDGIIRGSQELPSAIDKQINTLSIPVLDYQDPAQYIDTYSSFYDKILTE